MLPEHIFSILKTLISESQLSQRELAKRVGVSLGKINSGIKECRESGYLSENNSVTEKGMDVLQQYRVTNAVILAAGLSSRFVPLSYEYPKGLLMVKGERLIERQICQLKEAGIYDITIVVGYMKEMFFYLEDKYDVKIIVNEDYYRYNNSSSMMCVVDQLENTYICSSDNYFPENVFETYVYRSYYSALYAPGKTDEYCMTTDKQGRITNVKIGGNASWYMMGHVYFSKDFSDKFRELLLEEYKNRQTREELWECLYMRHMQELDMYIRKYEDDKILEFDSLEDLRSFDEHYVNNTNSKIIKNICKVLKCSECDVVNFEPLKNGFTNTSFCFSVNGKRYVYRNPGVGTEEYINRKAEYEAMNVAKSFALDNTYVYMDPVEGYKISYYLEDFHLLDYEKEEEVKNAVYLLKKLHASSQKGLDKFDIWDSIQFFLGKIEKRARLGEEFEKLYVAIECIYQYVSKESQELCLCHGDYTNKNILVDPDGDINIIDWECAGMADPAVDISKFICCSDYTEDKVKEILTLYCGKELNEQEFRHYLAYIALNSFYCYIWAIYREENGGIAGEHLYKWYKYAKKYARIVLDMYGVSKKELYRWKLNDEILQYISDIFQCEKDDIKDIKSISAGMTNHSFCFFIKEQKYICRIPGEGSEQLVNREHEKEAYQVVKDLDYTENIIAFREDGLKISEFIPGTRNADALNEEDVKKCMSLIRVLHKQKYQVSSTFDLWEKILYYEKLCKKSGVTFSNGYDDLKKEMKSLYDKVDDMHPEYVFCHIDCVPDNFLINEQGTLTLIDWEYAGMNDPLLDVAMYAIYSYYTKEQMDKLLCVYLGRDASEEEQKRYYAYVAMSGFLWKLWTDYKHVSGADFGDYGDKMEAYAEEYRKYV